MGYNYIQVSSFPPSELELLQQIVFEHRKLSCTIFSNEQEKHNISNYISIKHKDNKEIHIYPDRNVISYIIDFYNGNNKTIESQKISLAYLILFQLANIDLFNLIIACFELGSSSKESNNDIYAKEWDCFFSIKNQPPDKIMDFIRYSKYYDAKKYLQNYEKPDFEIFFNSGINWKSIYIHLLKMKIIDLENIRNNNSAIKKYLDWVYMEFKFDYVCSLYAFILFSRSRYGQMLPKNLDNIKNITWDLQLLSYWMRETTREENNKVDVILSFDSKLNKFALEIGNILYLNSESSEYIDYFNRISPETTDYFLSFFDKINKDISNPIRKKRSFLNEQEKDLFIYELETQLLTISKIKIKMNKNG